MPDGVAGNPPSEKVADVDNDDGPTKPDYIESGGNWPQLYCYKEELRIFYKGDNCQLFVAGIIFLNFLIVMFSVTEFAIEDPDIEAFCNTSDNVFLAIFGVELIINIISHMVPEDEAGIISPYIWRWEFCVGPDMGWNWFDFTVIIVPVVTLSGWASSVRILRLFRVIRVLRSIAKLPALQIVASSVTRSVNGIAAVAIMIFGLMCCYSIVGVNFFGYKEFKTACATKNNIPQWAIDNGFSNSWAEHCESYEMLYQCFANLKRALYTTFMMMTLESWPDLCWASTEVYAFGAIYFVTFVALNALMMANLIIAVFTTKMDKVAVEVQKEQDDMYRRRKKTDAEARNTIRNLSSKDGKDMRVIGIDEDGDGKADAFGLDVDGDGVIDVVADAQQMEEICPWTVGAAIEVYSHTVMEWCSGTVKEVNFHTRRIKVEYDVDGSTLGEKTVPFQHESIRRPAGTDIGANLDVIAASVGGSGENPNLSAILSNFQRKLDQIASNVDKIMAQKA